MAVPSGAAAAAAVDVLDAASQDHLDANIILPPPSAKNPLPALPAALRVDNQQQLLQLLLQNPAASGGSGDVADSTSSSSFGQWLVFGTDPLRTLLLRQVLSDPHARSEKFKATKAKKNWDALDYFPLPDVAKKRGLHLVGTQVLPDNSGSGDSESVFWDPLKDSVQVVTYFLRPTDLTQTQRAALHLQTWQKQQPHRSKMVHFRFVYLPQSTALVVKMLSHLGLLSMLNVSYTRLQLDVFPLETDVLSLELDDALREAHVEGTPSPTISMVARSLLKLQDVVGPIPRICALGSLGEEVVRKLLNWTVDEYLAGTSATESDDAYDATTSRVVPAGGQVAACIILDRKVDLVTPMVTPLTYEGLLDEIFLDQQEESADKKETSSVKKPAVQSGGSSRSGIDCGFLQVDVKIINPPEDNPEQASHLEPVGGDKDRLASSMVALGVNGSDSLYAEVRDQHVEKFGSFLQNQAMALRESHANFTSQKGKKKDLAEIHQFVKQIPVFTQNLRSLTNHIHLAELVKRTSEEATFRERWQLERSILEGETMYDALDDLVQSGQYPPYRFFRLLCLQSICAGGIKSSRYDSLRRDVVQTYGYEYLVLLQLLETSGLLRRREGLWMDTASPFNTLRKSLLLINPEVDTVEPDDVSYVSSGYAPLSVRLVQTTVKGWAGREDIFRDVPGRWVDIEQRLPPEDLATALKRPHGPSLESLAASLQQSQHTNGPVKQKPVLMVLYVGGVTYMELAALRFLSRRPSFPYHILCCTTKVINGSHLLQTLS